MDFLYFLVKQSSTYGVNEDPSSLLENYFVKEGAFDMAFICALIVALVCLIVFYGIFGMKIYKLATKTVYWITAGVASLLTFVLTQFIIVGSKSNITGFFHSVNEYFNNSEYIRNLQGEQRTLVDLQRDELENKMDSFCNAVCWLDVTNIFITLIIFILISLVVKNFTIHAKRIPL